MLPNGETCDGCLFWEGQSLITRTGKRLGQCHRHPPVVIVGDRGQPRTVYPLTIESDYCGEHAVPDD